MDNYIVDREILEQFFDELYAKKYPGQTPDASMREANINKLDELIGDSVFGVLNDDQLTEINQLFDNNVEDPSAYENFFKNAGVDLDQRISLAMQKFSAQFMLEGTEGGQNV
ncbi:hypothetical protein IJG04_02480 [Candidatus Saccharibacteria bacterium]|nr:hypothetical protein [Candidatus Saccharibacteria bacterium]